MWVRYKIQINAGNRTLPVDPAKVVVETKRKPHNRPHPHPKPHPRPHPHPRPPPYGPPPRPHQNRFDIEALRIEAVTISVGFDDMLDATLAKNHSHFDTFIVVTSHEDKLTQAVARKHSATCVLSDLFFKNGRNFNKGAAINAGFDYFHYYGWRMHLDADIVLPDNFRRLLFNHSHLERSCLYGADRFNVIGRPQIENHLQKPTNQHRHRLLLGDDNGRMGHRLACSLRGYLPCGYFQLWHSSAQKPYPYSLGTAAHDDMMFSALWPEHRRQLLPTVICHHLCIDSPKVGENWEGNRTQPRF